MSRKGHRKKITEKKNEDILEGWVLYNGLIEEYTFLRELPTTMTTGSGHELKKATLLIYHNH
jgi:hypothetical protein